jgi:hypothetical protein
MTRPRASCARHFLHEPFTAARITSAVPSPPSATGTTSMWTLSKTSRRPAAMFSATSRALSTPLNLSGATRIFTADLVTRSCHFARCACGGTRAARRAVALAEAGRVQSAATEGCPTIARRFDFSQVFNFLSRISPTTCGFAFPFDNFITWPLRKLSEAAWPARKSAEGFGLATIA